MQVVLSLSVNMQQELAARALRACMAAEAAMASLRAECKPLHAAAASTHRGCAISKKSNMGNAHRSLRLQIEACESFSLSATAAFKQLCDVFFNGESGNIVKFDQHNINRNHSQLSSELSSTIRRGHQAAIHDSEAPGSGIWRPESDIAGQFAASPPSHKEEEKGETAVKISAGSGFREVAQETIIWTSDIDVVYSRLDSPETENEASNIDETSASTAIEDREQDLQSDLYEETNQGEQEAPQSANLQESRSLDDSDASDSDLELRCEISSLRRNSTLPSYNSAAVCQHVAATSKVNHVLSSNDSSWVTSGSDHVPCSSTVQDGSLNIGVKGNQPTARSQSSLLHSDLRTSDHETGPTQTGDAGTNPRRKLRISGQGGSLQHEMKNNANSVNENSGPSCSSAITPCSMEVQDSIMYDEQLVDSQPQTPTPFTKEQCLPHAHPTWATISEMATPRSSPPAPTPSSSAHGCSLSSDQTLDVTQTHLPPRQNLTDSSANSMTREPSFTCINLQSPNLPLYNLPNPRSENKPLSASSAPMNVTRSCHQEHNISPVAMSSLLPERTIQGNRHFSPPLLPNPDQNYDEETDVPITPSPYLLKTRSLFTRANPAPEIIISSLSNSVGSQTVPGKYSMPAALSASPGYRRHLTVGATRTVALRSASSLSPGPVENQAHSLCADRLSLQQFSISPMSSTLSSSSSSWEATTSSSINSRDPEVCMEKYRKGVQDWQEHIPRLHSSFQEGHFLKAQGALGPGLPPIPTHSSNNTQFEPATPNQLGSTKSQNTCGLYFPALPQRPHHMNSIITEMECQGGSPLYTSRSGHVMRQNGAQKGAVGVAAGPMQRSFSYGSQRTLGPKPGDGNTKGFKSIASNFMDMHNAGGLRNVESGFQDVVRGELNKVEPSQERSNWRGPKGMRWDEDFSDGEGEETCSAPDSSEVALGGGGGGMVRVGHSWTQAINDGNEDKSSSDTRREWHTIVGNLQKGDRAAAEGRICSNQDQRAVRNETKSSWH